MLRPGDPDLALLAGDRLYALGLARLAELGDLEAVDVLAGVISRAAQAHAEGDPEAASAAWEAGARAVGRSARAERQLRPDFPSRSLLFAASCPPLAKSPSRSTPPTGSIPGAFEGETVTRRRFMTLTAHGAGAVAAARVHAARARLRGRLAAVRPAARPLAGRRQARGLPERHLRAEGHHRSTHGHRRGRQDDRLRARAATTRSTSRRTRRATTSRSSRSPRAACTSAARSATSRPRERFICPCHGGVYDFQGIVVGGPPVRPLDRFYTRVARRHASRSARATRSTPSSSASTPTATRRRTSTASASTSTRPASRRRSSTSRRRSEAPEDPLPAAAAPAPEAPGRAEARPARPGQGGRDPHASAGSTSAPRCPAPAAG